MKKILFIIMASTLLVMCKSTTASVTKVAEVHHTDDFESATPAEKKAVLKELKATGSNYSVLIFTKNYKGEKIIASTAGKRMYNGYVISDPKTGIADKARIANNADTRVYDNYAKKEIVISSEEAKKHKFIYLMKNPGGDTPYIVTYSNTLKSLK